MLKEAGVGDVIFLIAQTPVSKSVMAVLTCQCLDTLKYFQQACAVRGTTTNIERITGQLCHVVLRCHHGIYQIIDKQNIAYLSAISIEGEWLAFHCLDQKVCDPTLVFSSELMGAIDAAHTKHRGRDAISARVVQHVILTLRMNMRVAIHLAG